MRPSPDKADLPGFMQTQYAFAAHIRNPAQAPVPPGIEPRRMAIYSELFYNNVEDFMSSSYPVLRSLYSDDNWHALIRRYFSEHHATTPLFPEMAREFLKYLEEEYEPVAGDYPFMLELAHYEWVELALALADEQNDTPGLNPQGNLLEEKPVLSSLAWVQHYHYAVHKISVDHIPSEADAVDTYLLIYRDPANEIHFLELNPVTALLLDLLKEGSLGSGRAALQEIAQQMQHPNPHIVVQGGQSILNDLRQRQVILGTTLHK